MSSAHVTHLLTDYFDGTLNSVTEERVKSHLVFCNACRQVFHEIKRNVDLLKSTPFIQPSKELEQRILNRLSEIPSPTKSDKKESTTGWISWFLSFKGLSLAATAVLLVFFVHNAPDLIRETKTKKSALKKAPRVHSERSVDRTDSRPQGDRIIEDKSPWEEREYLSLHRKLANDSFQESAAESRPVPMPPVAVGGKEMSSSMVKKNSKDEAFMPPRAQKIRDEKDDDKLSKGEEPSKRFDNDVLSGQISGVTQPLEKVISDQKTWEEYWNRHQKVFSQKSPPPDVDFEKNEIIAVFGGTQPLPGCRLEIIRTISTRWENAPARVVRYRILEPITDIGYNTTDSQPFSLKIVPRSEGPTFFKKIR